MDNFPLKDETYKIIGACMEVQRTLGFGFSEIIYKDAIEVEFIANNFLCQRGKELSVTYKGQKLQHRFLADFIYNEQVIIELKSCDKGIIQDHIAQTLNYLRVSGNSIAVIVNFGKRKLEYKRLISNNLIR